ncbi:putative hydroxymethylpyrimidine transport system ATP-binding protein [Monaibacterium marinum]|uniref:Putative hydroxymethylpyrimidine transport system ATP-binding protein n=1 Tax=Pontivivens marinum TaxID=1690039 RepID=A0A2C9CQQ8_9RHOB|nr:ABC transporter ATP-binding protein [Monaibacterium marinum]SOH93881.1 putative hydroxymethylpyrimidine transport system ATP-binding protein [Monaibacterium marinum]
MTDAPGITLQGDYLIEQKPLFTGVDLTVPAGQWTCLLGRSGVGKSTILRLLLGLDTSGQFNGQVRANDDRAIGPRASYMAQSDLLLPWLNLRENVVLGARLRHEKPDLSKADTMIARVGLSAYATKKPGALSGGMRQRAALARTLMEDRPIALLDEPFSALDAGTRADMQDLAAEVLQGKTVLLVTHDPAEACRLGHQIALLTPAGIAPWELPDTAPIRSADDPQTLQAQAALLSYLRAVP